MERHLLNALFAVVVCLTPASAFEDREELAPSESAFDLSETQIDLVRLERVVYGHCRSQIAYIVSGHLEHCVSNGGQMLFKVQDRVSFEQWLDRTDFVATTNAYVGSRSFRKYNFRQGPGLYDYVETSDETCVAFYINTGRRARVQLTRPATYELFVGIHCLPHIVGVEETLIDDVNAVRLTR
jgi:hypothetical protein